MKADIYELVVFPDGELPSEELLGHCSDYARLALRYYRRGRLIRALFWAAMASASSSFETGYLVARGERDTLTRAAQLRGYGQ